MAVIARSGAMEQSRRKARSLRTHPPPMFGNLASGADPDPVAGGDVVEKLDEAGEAARATGQPVVQCQRHQLGVLGAFLVQDFETVDHVAREVLAGRKPMILIEAV